MYRGAAGIDALNKMMQEIFNPNDGKKKKSSFSANVSWRSLDALNKMMQEIFNPNDGKKKSQME